MHKGSRKADDDNLIAKLGPLRRYAQPLTRDAAQAEDLVHDTLLRAHEHRSAFRTGGNMRSWFVSILHNTFFIPAENRERRPGVLDRNRAAEPGFRGGAGWKLVGVTKCELSINMNC